MVFCAAGGPRPVVPYAVPPVPSRHRVGGVQGHVRPGGRQRLSVRVRGGLRFLGLPPVLRPPVSRTKDCCGLRALWGSFALELSGSRVKQRAEVCRRLVPFLSLVCVLDFSRLETRLYAPTSTDVSTCRHKEKMKEKNLELCCSLSRPQTGFFLLARHHA